MCVQPSATTEHSLPTADAQQQQQLLQQQQLTLQRQQLMLRWVWLLRFHGMCCFGLSSVSAPVYYRSLDWSRMCECKMNDGLTYIYSALADSLSCGPCCCIITACAIATSCCISDVPSQWEGKISTPHFSHIFQPILIKLKTKKDIWDTTPRAKYGWCGTTGRGSA